MLVPLYSSCWTCCAKLPTCKNHCLNAPLSVLDGHHGFALTTEYAVAIKVLSQVTMLPQAISKAPLTNSFSARDVNMSLDWVKSLCYIIDKQSHFGTVKSLT